MISHTIQETFDNLVLITDTNTGLSMEMNCSIQEYENALKEYETGSLIQNCFYFLSPDEREFFITGMTPDEYAELEEWAEENQEEWDEY